MCGADSLCTVPTAHEPMYGVGGDRAALGPGGRPAALGCAVPIRRPLSAGVLGAPIGAHASARSAPQVPRSTTPSAVRPLAFWKSRTALSVPGPKSPSVSVPTE